jgi:hypothetical protein
VVYKCYEDYERNGERSRFANNQAMTIDMIRDSSFDKLTWVVVELISSLCEETIDEECNKFVFEELFSNETRRLPNIILYQASFKLLNGFFDILFFQVLRLENRCYLGKIECDDECAIIVIRYLFIFD